MRSVPEISVCYHPTDHRKHARWCYISISSSLNERSRTDPPIWQKGVRRTPFCQSSLAERCSPNTFLPNPGCRKLPHHPSMSAHLCELTVVCHTILQGSAVAICCSCFCAKRLCVCLGAPPLVTYSHVFFSGIRSIHGQIDRWISCAAG